MVLLTETVISHDMSHDSKYYMTSSLSTSPTTTTNYITLTSEVILPTNTSTPTPSSTLFCKLIT